MTDDEKRQWIADFYECPPGSVSQCDINALGALVARIEADVRAAILADEERRVWMELYIHEIYNTRNESASIALANRRLTVWRDARAAWEARDG